MLTRPTHSAWLRHAASGIDIDLTFGRLSFEQAAIDRSEIHEIGGLREFSTAMSMSDMLDDFDKVVARSKSTR